MSTVEQVLVAMPFVVITAAAVIEILKAVWTAISTVIALFTIAEA